MNRFITWCRTFYEKTEENSLLLSIRNGMVLTIPAVMAGSTALLLKSIPIPAYQELLTTKAGAVFANLLNIVQNSTLGIISLIILLAVSYSYARNKSGLNQGVTLLVSLCSYIAFTMGPDFELTGNVFQSTWMFYAILISQISPALFHMLYRFFTRRHTRYAGGNDILIENMLANVLPAIATVSVFAVINRLITLALGGMDLQTALTAFTEYLFLKKGPTLFNGLFFIFDMHFMWFFGIHGSNVLDGVAHNIFEPTVAANMQVLLAGGIPDGIISKTFFDAFVLFGGCGSLLCLVLAILIGDRRDNVRSLTKAAILPALFNINELLMFGIPVVFHPVYFIPFLATPLLLTLVSYLATAAGLVPCAIHSVEWTTPIFLSGYTATGSAAGSLLQLFNLALGTCVYLPFVHLAQVLQKKQTAASIARLTALVQEAENRGRPPALTAHDGRLGQTARALVNELQKAIQEHKLQLYYQPQVRYDRTVAGAEALLRWKIDDAEGFLYPPLVIALATEAGLMDELDSYIIQQTCADISRLAAVTDDDFTVSFNLTPEQFSSPSNIDRILKELSNYPYAQSRLGLEITEQAMFNITPSTEKLLEKVRAHHISIIIDDFGMGHSSMIHMQKSQFDLVKLDGALVRDIAGNSRSRDIVSSILYLSRSLSFEVLGEQVETEEQMEILHRLGCDLFQGYFYSRPIPFEELMEFIQKR